MGNGNSNKPIVFVFGAKKGDADGRKKNLSAINTQVAYRAHERRREKNLKSRQRGQAKDDENEGQPSASTLSTPSIRPESSSSSSSSSLSVSVQRRPSATPFVSGIAPHPLSRRLLGGRRDESDIASDVSSDRDTVSNELWSASPSSARQSTPSTDLSSSSPLIPVQINTYLDQALDPFYRLPAVASDREKWLIHFCK